MKRIGNLWNKVIDIDNLRKAYKRSRRGHTKLKLVQEVDKNPEYYLEEIQKLLTSKTYHTSKYKIFNIVERGKKREICDLPYFPDRIVHWALMQQIEPIFRKLFIYDTYAALPNKGTHKALSRLRMFMKDKEGTQYCLKLDVRKYYNSIDKDILKQMLRKYIKCKDTLWLIDEIIDSYTNGIPIGNYTSQYFGNFFLSEFDHWLKEEKRIKYYLRYMDDLIILHESKEFLHKLKDEIDDYLTNIHLTLKQNWQVFPTFIRGVDYVGYRSFENYTLLRKSTKKRMKKSTKVIERRVKNKQELTSRDIGCYSAYNGILKWCSGYRLRKSSLEKIDKSIEKEKRKCRNTNKSKGHKNPNQKKLKSAKQPCICVAT